MVPIEFFWRAAQAHPGRTAVIDDGHAVTYRELAGAVVDRAGEIAQSAPPGAAVAIGAGNSLDHLVALLATLAAGATWVPLNPRNGDPELERIIEFVRPALVALDDGMDGRLDAPGVPRARLSRPARPRGGALPLGPGSTRAWDLDGAQAIKLTGGTTGRPKAVVQPVRAWNATIVSHRLVYGLGPDDRYLVAAPITHGSSTYLLPVLAVGGALILPGAGAADAQLDAAAENAATLLFAPPTLLGGLVERQRAQPRDLTALRHVVYGGAPMPERRIEEAQDTLGPVIATSYGQTEAPQIATFLPAVEMTGSRRGSVGRAGPLARIAVFDPEGQPVPAGTVGEIAVHGDLVMSGYLHDLDATRAVLRDGWLRTGDLGELDDEGFLRLRGRHRNVIITGGFNVYPSDVETVLAEHPAVAESAVVGVPDDKWGEAVHAAVRLRAGYQSTPQELTAHVRRALGPVKAPKGVHLLDHIPRNPVGKIVPADVVAEIRRRRQPEPPSGEVSAR